MFGTGTVESAVPASTRETSALHFENQVLGAVESMAQGTTQVSVTLAATSAVDTTTTSDAKATTSIKPKSPCVFCGEFQNQLPRHLKRKHCNEEPVSAALKLPPLEQKKAFDARKAFFNKM